MQKLIDQLKIIKKWAVLPPDVIEQVWGALLSLGIRGASQWTWQASQIIERPHSEEWGDLLLEKFIASQINYIEGQKTNPQLEVDRRFERELCKVFNFNWEHDFVEKATKEYERARK